MNIIEKPRFKVDSVCGRAGRRVVPVVLLLDTSGSMSGTPIGALNMGVRNLLNDLCNKLKDNERTFDIEVIAVSFNSKAEYVQGIDGLVSPEDYSWSDLPAAGFTSFGAALEKLCEILDKLNKQVYSKQCTYARPVIMLFSDGSSTDLYKDSLDKLTNNDYYKNAVIRVVEFGDACDHDMLKQFARDEEFIIKVDDIDTLANVVRDETSIATDISIHSF